MNVRKRLLRKSNVCALCGGQIINMKDATIDHIVPISRGGGDEIANLQVAHLKCNLEKGNKYVSNDPENVVA